MKAIFTTFRGYTNTKPSRIAAADADGNSVVLSTHADGMPDSDEAKHRFVAEALCKKMKWPGRIIGGGHKKGYVFVFAPELDAALDALQTAHKLLTLDDDHVPTDALRRKWVAQIETVLRKGGA